jgi:hypothetical protein
MDIKTYICEELVISHGSRCPMKEKASIKSKGTIKISINNKQSEIGKSNGISRSVIASMLRE